MQNKCNQKMQKTKCNHKIQVRKEKKTMQSQMQKNMQPKNAEFQNLHLFSQILCIFGRASSQSFKSSKLQRREEKIKKTMRGKNAKKLNNSRSCICLHVCLHFSFYFFCSFLHFPGPRLLGLYFLGAFVCIFLQFNQLLQSLE